MPKNIVYPQVTFTQFVEEPILKRLSLFFDKIYVGEGRLNHLMTTNPGSQSEYKISIDYEKSVWQFLIDKGIVTTYPFLMSKFDNAEHNKESEELIKQLTKIMPQGGARGDETYIPTEEELAEVRTKALHNIFLSHDISVRLDAIELRKQYSDEFYPAVRTNATYSPQTEKKSSVIQFLLNDIPQPDTSTPWEQIVDFRSDEDVKNKYLALINWINKVSNSSGSLSDIKDEYEYLYNDYIRHFKLHKLKYNNTIL
jgi:hypothetical protein